MTQNKTERYKGKKVVIPGFSMTGLGTARCLVNSHSGIISIGHKEATDQMPFYFSNIPEKKIITPPEQNIVQVLLDIRDTFTDPPVLLLTRDKHVLEVSEDRSLIERYYKFLLPSKGLVNDLMDKNKFAQLAQEKGFNIPTTIRIRGPEEISKVIHELSFPFILKPHLLHAHKINSEIELESYLNTLSSLNWSSVIAQELIPGDDSSIYCCFVYFSRDQDLIAHVTIQKIRQWKPQDGTTSLCRTVENSYILEETTRIFKTLGLVGYGQIEYKYYPDKNTYYIMEPTIGRFNQQIAITQSAGVNFPLIAMQYLEEGNIPRYIQRDNVWWIHELNDLLSVRHPLQTNRRDYWRHLVKAETHVLFSLRDIRPFLETVGWALKQVIKQIIKNARCRGKKILQVYRGK